MPDGGEEKLLDRARGDPGERLLQTATTLFCREGIHATGIERIIDESGVSRMTLYARFGSKGRLVEAVLEREGEAWRHWLFKAVTDRARDPRGRLLAVFDALHEWFMAQPFTGCAFINAVAEHSKADDRMRGIALQHKAKVFGFLTALAVEGGFRDAERVAAQIALLVDGAIIEALMKQSPAPAALARGIAEGLLNAAPRADGGSR